MTDTPVEGNQQQPAGGQEQPTSAPSGGQQGQPLPEYIVDLNRRLDEQDKFLRGLQKGTDKQIQQAKDDVVKRVLELQAEGLNQRQIERELWIDQQMRAQSAPPAPVPGTNTPRAADSVTVDASSVFKQLGLDASDPDVAIELGKGFKSETEAKAAAFDLMAKKAKQPTPTPAQSAALQGSTPSSKLTDADRERIAGELINLQREPTRNAAQIAKLKEQLKG